MAATISPGKTAENKTRRCPCPQEVYSLVRVERRSKSTKSEYVMCRMVVREFSSVLCNDLEEWDGEGDGREFF